SAWENDESLPQNVRDFYHYHSSIMEPWDGPAAIVFTDGRYVAAALDRNGLRPARYKIYDDGIIVLASETGLLPDGKAKIVSTGRLGPGRMIAIDLAEKRLLQDSEIKQ